jgi:hypothetical protein
LYQTMPPPVDAAAKKKVDPLFARTGPLAGIEK